ncbi:hypothetical protein CTI14_41480 [Methylobacterium radiotolerans]|nr:hypothetical protein CTI14_41480 [Methylobacterium radiotolerans]
MDGRENGRAPEAAARKPARERILETAYGLFAKRGVSRRRNRRDHREIGRAKATFYRHFPSKEALVPRLPWTAGTKCGTTRQTCLFR